MPLIIHSDRGSQYISKEYKQETFKIEVSPRKPFIHYKARMAELL